MEVYRPLRAGLFGYECVRLFFLTGVFVFLQPGERAAFPWLVYAVPNALFPLMALFWWLDFQQYRSYGPLYAAGKCISVFSIAGWCVFSWRHIMAVVLFGRAAVFMIPGIIGILLIGDVLSAAAGLFIVKKTQTQGGTAGVPAAAVEHQGAAEQAGPPEADGAADSQGGK